MGVGLGAEFGLLPVWHLKIFWTSSLRNHIRSNVRHSGDNKWLYARLYGYCIRHVGQLRRRVARGSIEHDCWSPVYFSPSLNLCHFAPVQTTRERESAQIEFDPGMKIMFVLKNAVFCVDIDLECLCQFFTKGNGGIAIACQGLVKIPGPVRMGRNSPTPGEMSLAQWEVVFLCTAINMLDGYDVLVMSFAAAPVAAGLAARTLLVWAYIAECGIDRHGRSVRLCSDPLSRRFG